VDHEVLERLEEKTRRAVEVLAALRSENERLSRELEEAKDRATPAEDSGREALEDQLRLLRDERQAVRNRVEGLIRMIEEAL
jgi:FtsZ-binding cell division protein ZapB